ncbi:MAG: hypothetical protein ACAH59_03455 [Pseudobdellovibrionaceae bacterium]
MKEGLFNLEHEDQFFALYAAECQRKERLLDEFEKLERIERRRKKPNNDLFKRKYERVVQGLFFVEQTSGDFIHLVDEDGKELGQLHVNREISQLLQVNDGLEGTFGFRDRYWRIQFLFSILSSADDLMPKDS